MASNPRTYAYLLYLRVDDPKCQKLLIEKFHIPQRGARICPVDVDMLMLEKGGKDILFIEHPWMRVGYPILVSTRRNVKFFGYKDVIDELTRYHTYLDDYHASLQESKLPTTTQWPTTPGGANPWHGMTPNPGGGQGMRPPALIPTQQPTAPQAQPQPQQIQPNPIVPTQPKLDPRIDPRLIQNMQPKSEQKQIANVPVSLPPPQDPNTIKSQVLVPVKTDWSKIYQTATDQLKPTEPLLSQQVNQPPPQPQINDMQPPMQAQDPTQGAIMEPQYVQEQVPDSTYVPISQPMAPPIPALPQPQHMVPMTGTPKIIPTTGTKRPTPQPRKPANGGAGVVM